MTRRVILAVMTVALSSCGPAPDPAQPSRDRNRISTEEIAAEAVTTAHELISKLRPAWLRARGPTSMRGGTPSVPLVYIDEVRTGSLDSLYRVSTQIIREIQFINGRDATTKWGLDHGGGVILILTGR